jgi:membrane protein
MPSFKQESFVTVSAVFFDIDGTLVDSNEQHVAVWSFVFRDEGHPQEEDAIRAQIGKGGDQLIPALLPDAGEALRTRLAEEHGERFKALYLDHVRAFEGAADLIRRVRASGRKVVLASSAKQAELDHYIDLLGVRDELDATASADDADASKPAPDIFAIALERAGVPPEEVLVVGDTPYDIEAAQRAGIAAIGLTSGPFSEAELKDAGAIAVYADVAALLADFDRSPLAQ